MKFFGWMHNKLNGKQGSSRPSTSSVSHHIKQEPREEFSDWPQGLLAIGTFGTNNGVSRKIREIQEEASNAHHDENSGDQDQDQDQDPSSSDDLQDFTPEEVGKLEKELTRLLTRTKKRKSDAHRELSTSNLPLDRFLNCPSSLEVDRRISNIDSDDKDEDIERTISVILGRCKEISTDNNNNKIKMKKKKKKKTDISKASVSYLLKKMFVCSEGFSSPSLRDTLQESRMEKFLRMMLHKKINSQASSRATSAKRYLQDKQQVSNKIDEEEEPNDKSNDGCKWVKTDSDYLANDSHKYR